jgi:IS30 family transposase
MAVLINRDASFIMRELTRNRDLRSGKYSSEVTQKKYDKRQLKKLKKVRLTAEIKATIRKYLVEDFSPDQIVGVFKKTGIDCVL